MKFKILILILLGSGIITGGYFYYHHNYVETLMLSEVVGPTDNPAINIVVSLADFDTGLTRHDLMVLEDNKDYWIDRIHEVEAIRDPDQKQQASLKLLSDMMEDPVLKKICSEILNLGFDISLGLIETIL